MSQLYKVNYTTHDALDHGVGGMDYFSDTSSHIGNWGVLEVDSDAVFTTLTISNQGGASLAGPTWSAGKRWYGDITAIELASGSVTAYRIVGWPWARRIS